MDLGKTYTQVSIATTSSTAAKVLLAGATGQIGRLHELVVTLSTTGTVQVLSGSVALTGKMGATGNAAIVIPWRPQIEGCLASSAGAALSINSTAATLAGYAIVSASTA